MKTSFLTKLLQKTNTKAPKVSIITVCRNEQERISYTLDSILNQTSKDYELIICDGASSDNTYDIVLKYKEKFIKKGIRCYTQSQRDGGIFQGMNCGIEKAQGEYLLFMNGGDGFYSNQVLKNIINIMNHTNADVFYGNYEVVGSDSRSISIASIERIRFGACINHQSAFIKSEWLKKRPYRTDLKISDYEYWLYMLKNDAIFYHMEMVVACFNLYGLSSNIELVESEMGKINESYSDLKYFYPSSCNKTSYSYENYQDEDSNLDKGWNIAELQGVWSVGNKSSFVYELKNTTDLCLLIEIKNRIIAYDNQLYVNGHFVCNITRDLGEHYIFIAKEFLVQGHNEFEIRCKDKVKRLCEIYPSCKDTRRLNLFISKTAIYEEEFLSSNKAPYYVSCTGWSFEENGYCWTIGNCTSFCTYVTQIRSLSLCFDVKVLQDYNNELYVNDVFVAKIEKKTGRHNYFINETLLHKGVNTFTIKTTDEVVEICKKNKESSDVRRLNLFIGNIQFI